MNLQFLSQRCLPHQGKNPETGRCYDVCKPGEVYKAQEGCKKQGFEWTFLVPVVLIGGVVYVLLRR